jgi:uncharacterized protein (TIGR03000 family)
VVAAQPVAVAAAPQGGGAGGGTGGGTGGAGSGSGSGSGQQPNLPAPTRQSTLGNSARLIVKAPTDARVTVNGYETRRTTAEEGFITPALEPGQTYTYEVKAEATREGRPMLVRQRVKVLAGQESVADFSELNVPSGNSAQVTVVLPSEADLFIDGVRCPLTSGRRTFTTPALDRGRTYYYSLRAEITRDGQRYKQSQRVVLEAGKAVTVEFDRLGVQSASR